MVLYVHGKGGSAAEAAHYEPLFPGQRVVGADYRGGTPWDCAPELRAAAAELKADGGRLTLVANSIGAYYSLFAGLGDFADRAYFISPIVDMERLIRGMMTGAGVTEAELEARGRVPTPFGEELSWEYLCRVREKPLRWAVPTEILYGGRDGLTDRGTVVAFARACGAGLTVMENGEHWFHTEEQMAFLDAWIRNKEGGSPRG